MAWSARGQVLAQDIGSFSVLLWMKLAIASRAVTEQLLAVPKWNVRGHSMYLREASERPLLQRDMMFAVD